MPGITLHVRLQLQWHCSELRTAHAVQGARAHVASLPLHNRVLGRARGCPHHHHHHHHPPTHPASQIMPSSCPRRSPWLCAVARPAQSCCAPVAQDSQPPPRQVTRHTPLPRTAPFAVVRNLALAALSAGAAEALSPQAGLPGGTEALRRVTAQDDSTRPRDFLGPRQRCEAPSELHVLCLSVTCLPREEVLRLQPQAVQESQPGAAPHTRAFATRRAL
jgi:hypothetical protein